jgi:hypothetical protein
MTSQPRTCAVFEVPQFWLWPDPTPAQSGLTLEYYELRRSRIGADELVIGLRSMKYMAPNASAPPSIALRSKNKFAFRFHPADANNLAKVDGVRPASEEQWADAEALSYLDSGDFMDIDLRGDVVGGDVVFKGQRFPKDEKYPNFSTRRMVSVNEVFIAVPSFSGPRPATGVSFGFNVFTDPWRRAETIDIFQVSTLTRIARIRGWTCFEGLGQIPRIVWHGDQYFSMPLTADKRQVLLCDFHGL